MGRNSIHYGSETDKLAALITDNNVRVKSNWQLANEAAALMGIAQERAKERQGARTDLIDIVEPVPPSSNGKARDEVGEQLGVSGRTVSDLLFVKKEVDKLAQAGEADRMLYSRPGCTVAGQMWL